MYIIARTNCDHFNDNGIQFPIALWRNAFRFQFWNAFLHSKQFLTIVYMHLIIKSKCMQALLLSYNFARKESEKFSREYISRERAMKKNLKSPQNSYGPVFMYASSILLCNEKSTYLQHFQHEGKKMALCLSVLVQIVPQNVYSGLIFKMAYRWNALMDISLYLSLYI